jgi:hypothetical protein
MKSVSADTDKQRWERDVLQPALAKAPERAVAFTTISGRDIDRLYAPEDLPDLDYARDLNDPGSYPYTRGIHATGYRGKLWTMRQFAGFGTPEETNRRYRTLLNAGGTGLSVAFDLPTLMGRDPEHPLSLGEVGKCGVSIVSLADMERLFDGIALADVTTSMTINSPAAMIFAMYLVVAERQGESWKQLSGTIQNDILKEFIAQKEYIYPPRESMRLVTDLPYPDGGCVAHRPTAVQQRGPHGVAGARGGARRDEFSAHEFTGRSPVAANRGSGDPGPAHPADTRPRERHHQYRGSIGRLVFSGATDPGCGAGRQGLLRDH